MSFEVGDIEISRSGGGLTLTVIVREWVRFPNVPVRVVVYVPAGAEVVEDSVIVDDTTPFAGGVTDGGLNEAETPEGRPVIDSVTLEVKPPSDPTTTVVLLLVPADSTRLGIWLVMLKSLTSTKYVIVFAERPSALTTSI